MFARVRSLPKKQKERIQAVSFLLPFGITVSVMLYGILRWPMAPIREVAGRYVDKVGASFTEDVYHQFLIWQTTLASCFFLFFGSVFIVGWIIGMPFGKNRSRDKQKA